MGCEGSDERYSEQSVVAPYRMGESSKGCPSAYGRAMRKHYLCPKNDLFTQGTAISETNITCV